MLPVLRRQYNLIYPSCSIHERIYDEFCSQFLIHCFTDYKGFTIRLWHQFYDTHFNREIGFFIKGEGNFVFYYGMLYNRVHQTYYMLNYKFFKLQIL